MTATLAAKGRYQILRQIGVGDFATVYAARDLKLGREVALKQFHPQFLADPQRLARYWREAELLAAVEHAHVITMYDVLKSSGCLVLELAQGSLADLYGAAPMPLDELRQTILQTASGLALLHSRGVLHGDIKPGNLLLSRQGVVKIGDFGLARRASESNGSLLKGTARYIAPEVLTDQLGPVGPASDLYSLGFAALELLCGPDFDSHFPGLGAFGRDQQMAWLLWHSAVDRQPPDPRTLRADIPDDLAHVLRRLTAKHPAERYASAEQVLADLQSFGPVAVVGDAAQQAERARQAAEQARKTRRRRRALAACVFSVLLSAVLLWIPLSPPPAPPEPPPPPPLAGVVRNVLVESQTFVIEVDGDWKEIRLFPEDRLYVNRRERPLRDLHAGDRVVIRQLADEREQPFQEVAAFRPARHSGVVAAVTADEGRLRLRVDEGPEAGAELVLHVAGATPLTLNGDRQFDGAPLTLAALAAGDRAQVECVEDETGLVALAVAAERVLARSGVVRELDLVRGRLVLSSGAGDDATFVSLPLNADCEVTLNGQRLVADRLLTAGDLRPGDRVDLRHDVRIVRIDARRTYQEQGVVRGVDEAARTLLIEPASGGEPRGYAIPATSDILLGEEAIELAELRRGDRVQVTHDSPPGTTAVVQSLAATRPADPSKWALLLATERFDDSALPPLALAEASARRLRDRLVHRYAVPAEQAVLLADESRIRWEQAIPAWLQRIPAESEVYVYVVTHGQWVAEDNAYLAGRDFDRQRPAETGVRLDWLLDQLDQCRAGRKLLLLDGRHVGAGAAGQGELSAVELLASLRERRRPFLRSAHALAIGQAGAPRRPEAEVSPFAHILCDAFAGQADRERDNRLDIAELSQFVERRLAAEGGASSSGRAQLFLPNDEPPPRLSPEAVAAIRRLHAHFGQTKLDVLKMRFDAEHATRLAPGQPEPPLLCGLLLLKARQRDDALKVFEQLRLEQDDVLLAHQAVAWIHFEKWNPAVGVVALKSLLDGARPTPPAETGPAPETLELLEWTGRLREFGAAAPWLSRKPSAENLAALDAAAAAHGEAAVQRYEAGRAHVRALLSQLPTSDSGDGPRVAATAEQTLLTNYAQFDLDRAANVLRDGLND